MRSSRLPAFKRLTEFDFSFQPSLRREQMESLHELGFVERRENVVVLGPPGVGKTHLAISLAIAAAQSGRWVYYGTPHIVTIRGNSYRMRQHTDLWHALHTTQDPEPAPNRRRRARQEASTN